MTKIKVTRPSGDRCWYDTCVGECFTLINTDYLAKDWLVWAADGCTNIIRFTDGEPAGVADDI